MLHVNITLFQMLHSLIKSKVPIPSPRSPVPFPSPIPPVLIPVPHSSSSFQVLIPQLSLLAIWVALFVLEAMIVIVKENNESIKKQKQRKVELWQSHVRSVIERADCVHISVKAG